MKHDGLRWPGVYFVHRVVNNVTKSLEISSWSPVSAAAILNMNQKYLKPICSVTSVWAWAGDKAHMGHGTRMSEGH